jgi:hypothetical protein
VAGFGWPKPESESSEASGTVNPPVAHGAMPRNPLKFQAEHGFARLRKFDWLVEKTVELADMAS